MVRECECEYVRKYSGVPNASAAHQFLLVRRHAAALGLHLRRRGAPNGAFLYRLASGPPILYVLSQGDDALAADVRRAMAEARRGASAEEASALADAASAMRSNLRGLYDGWQGALRSVLRDFDLEVRERDAFDAGETRLCGSATRAATFRSAPNSGSSVTRGDSSPRRRASS